MILGSGPLATAIRENVGEVDFTWVAYDAEYGETTRILQLIRPTLRKLSFESIVAISTQLPVGTCARLEMEFPGLWFAVVPENLRTATASADWKRQDRIVVGARQFKSLGPLIEVLEQFSETILFMSPESAEFSKHALNGFLAVSVAYANEIARLAALHGADPTDVAKAVMADSRIGPRAYLKPGGGPGAHLQREVDNLVALGAGAIIRAAR